MFAFWFAVAVRCVVEPSRLNVSINEPFYVNITVSGHPPVYKRNFKCPFQSGWIYDYIYNKTYEEKLGIKFFGVTIDETGRGDSRPIRLAEVVQPAENGSHECVLYLDIVSANGLSSTTLPAVEPSVTPAMCFAMSFANTTVCSVKQVRKYVCACMRASK